jgi:hypothetical protein
MFVVENDQDYRTPGRFLPFYELARVEREIAPIGGACVGPLQGPLSGSFKDYGHISTIIPHLRTMLLANFAIADTTPPACHRT